MNSPRPNCRFHETMKPTLTTLITAILLAPVAAPRAADKPAKPNPDQFAGMDPNEGRPWPR